MKKLLLILISFLLLQSTFGQKSRYRFAETYFGLEAEMSPQSQSFNYIENGVMKTAEAASTITPRFLIGGTHFWGHADFYISLPLTNIRINGSKEMFQTNGVLTGFRVLPFQLEKNKLRPFLGTGFHSKTLVIGDGPMLTNWQWYYESGLSYRNGKNKVFGIELRYFPQSEFNNPIDRNSFSNTKLDPWAVSFTYKKVIDFSRGYERESSKKFFEKMKLDLQENKQLNTYSFGIGITAFIPFERTEHASRNSFFNDEIESQITFDLGLGYYHHKLDAYGRLSYRPIQQFEEAHDYSYKLNRHSVALETFKFIGDYHGFVPFVGPFISADYYRLEEKDQGQTITDINRRNIGYGIVFGWDIRFTETDHFILRTNLRYNPDFGLKEDGLSFTAKGLEFNFIQLVVYPERMKMYKKLLKR